MQKSILVIDDEDDVLQIVRSVLNTKGHEVYTTNSGEEGVELASQIYPDLVICDLMMPRVSGLEVIKRLKASEETRNIPIMIMSALGQKDDRPPEFWMNALGVDDYLAKPFDPLDLLGRVEYLIRRSGYVSLNEPAAKVSNSGNETQIPMELGELVPEEVVRAFIEAWNRQDFGTEYKCLDEELTGQMKPHDYVTRRRQNYMEEKGNSRFQKLVTVEEVKISVNVAKVVVLREDTVAGKSSQREETYTLKKTYKGWKIITYRSTRRE
jgi:DNA-binding response OmpR family regulator